MIRSCASTPLTCAPGLFIHLVNPGFFSFIGLSSAHRVPYVVFSVACSCINNTLTPLVVSGIIHLNSYPLMSSLTTLVCIIPQCTPPEPFVSLHIMLILHIFGCLQLPPTEASLLAFRSH